jgi:hypothetical protein
MNDPQDEPGVSNCGKEVRSMNHWQPLCVPPKRVMPQNFVYPPVNSIKASSAANPCTVGAALWSCLCLGTDNHP